MSLEAGKWYILGCPFVALSDEATTINDLLGDGFTDGDLLYIFDSASGGYSNIRAWKTIDGVGVWCNGTADSTIATDIVDPNQGFFVRKGSTSSTITIAGVVSSAEVGSVGNENASCWDMKSLCYPEATAINNLTWTGVQDGDLLYVFDPDYGGYSSILAWKTVDGVGAWRKGTADSTLSDYTITPANGFLMYKRSTGIATFQK